MPRRIRNDTLSTRMSASLPALIRRRAFLRSLAGAGAAAGLAAYGRWLEPGWLETTLTRIPFFPPSGGAPLRILHLSDLHLSPEVPLTLLADAFRLGLEQNPHLAVLTGDFITAGHSVPTAYVRELAALSSRCPTIACLGNHDYGIHHPHSGPVGFLRPDARLVRGLLEQAGILLLHNESMTWMHRGRAVELIGLGDWWTGKCAPEAAFPATDRGLPRLVLCHNPDAKTALRDYRWNAMLCGHSHGGQLRLPVLGCPFAPLEDKRYAQGLNPWEGRWIFTTRGVGNLHGFRLFCRPEVSLLELA